VAYVLTVCVLFEKGENMRFKYFLEPAWMVLLIATAVSAWRKLCDAQGADSSGDKVV
jgi:hypothetical protein